MKHKAKSYLRVGLSMEHPRRCSVLRKPRIRRRCWGNESAPLVLKKRRNRESKSCDVRPFLYAHTPTHLPPPLWFYPRPGSTRARITHIHTHRRREREESEREKKERDSLLDEADQSESRDVQLSPAPDAVHSAEKIYRRDVWWSDWSPADILKP